ncbi:MAG: glucoamylase family protein [Bacillota bacterium]|nr:glucoamylase family protein [Bacillota bacterium]
MPYVVLIILICLMGTYILVQRQKQNSNDSFEDIPSINVNKTQYDNRAFEISHYNSSHRRISSKRILMRNLDKNYYKILRGYEYIDRDVRNKREVVPAAEWLLDNLYLIEKEYKDIKHNMPEGFYRNLPIIDEGIMKGFPRVYHIAAEIISRTDGRVDENNIISFVQTYQENSVLTSAELWALPAMLRIAIIQNLGKVTEKIVFAQKEKLKANIISDRIINIVSSENSDEKLKEIFNEELEFSSHFTERILKVLRDNGIDNEKVYKWIDKRLEVKETNADKMITLEHQKEAGLKLSMGNLINGIREVEALNWKDCFEKLSIVENILLDDPADVYSQMDFPSKDYYRHKIEKQAKIVGMPESYIARMAIECAREAEDTEGTPYIKHVGYYLIDDGIKCLKEKINYRSIGINALKDNIRQHKVGYYIAANIIGTFIITALAIWVSLYNDPNPIFWRYLVAAAAILIPCSEIVNSILNWSFNHLVKPQYVPKLYFKKGIPEEYSTVVVIPTLLNSIKRVEELISNIEVYYLANQEKNLYFALLGDFKDSRNEKEQDDNEINQTALNAVKELNEKYSQDGEEIFYFFNRYRKFNKKQGIWMGWERKRGKLMEFNRLLRGDKNTSYNIISGDISKLKNAKYIITLDADTQLPRESAKKLIGAMAHILNVVHIKNNRVARGYGIMQPRISISTISANKTLFSKIFSGETGIDTYSTAVSDVYQDLFGEGIFTGKGIYRIDTFDKMLGEDIPENAVLSHDLLEGAYVRCALVSDIELIDDYPSYYNSNAKRIHRWTRGDWQLLPWLFKMSPINALSRWKIFDNLRRSLMAPSFIILIILILTVMPDGKGKWLSFAFIALICPWLFDVSEAVASPLKGVSLSGKLDNNKNTIEQVFLIYCFLPYQAYLMLDAIIRTLYRITISKKNLLEWQTAADTEAKSGKTLSSYVSSMWIGSVIALIIGALAFYKSPSMGVIMLPSVIIWFLSPSIAYSISKVKKIEVPTITEGEKELLRRMSRKTYAYFEDFVCNETNWLAPDNFQQDPNNGIAFRTSPTNMAMGLTSNIAAYDLGYIGFLELINKMDKILAAMEELERYKGHFYNWYNTKTKEPLHPRYVSTVDSGNLVCYLWVVSRALDEYIKMPILNKKFNDGLCDTLRLANEEIKEVVGESNYYGDFINEARKAHFDIVSWKKFLSELWSRTVKFDKGSHRDELYWNEKVKHAVSKYMTELQTLLPWTDLINEKASEIGEISDRLRVISFSSPINELTDEIGKLLSEIKDRKGKANNSWSEELGVLLDNGKNELEKLLLRVKNLKDRFNTIVEETDFKMLYDYGRQLFTIGYDIERDALSKNYYDLLASEARQASFIAIAKGEIEQSHWFKLGRAMTMVGRNKGLVSWSGTMFEYYMPLLIMRNYPDTLLNETYKTVVEGQKKYGRDRRIPCWGISESAYYNFDVALNYQYKAFGVPGLGLKRGLANELVISPYSTVMALQMDLHEGINNMRKLIQEGMEGRYGFYEAIDYTNERIKKVRKGAIVKCFMVHHEGMSLMALNNVLNNNIFQERFHALPKVKATELLLQERVPKRVVYDREQQFEVSDTNNDRQNIIVRTYTSARTETPETHLLSNGSYSLMISNSGSGYSKKDDMMVYRWKEDATLDNSGMFFYIKDVTDNNRYWSAAYEPCKSEGEGYEVVYSLDKAEFKRKDGDILTKMKIAVSNEEDAEVRKLSISNQGSDTKIIEVTSYCEVTLSAYNADIVHPAFSNLFVSTEFNDELQSIIATRRPRTKSQKKPWVMQTAVVEGEVVGTIQYETSRVNFIGRNKNVSSPEAMENDTPLTNTVGAVLDPIISIRRRIKLEPGSSCKIYYVTAITDSREEVLSIARKYNDLQNTKRIFELAWTQSQVELNYLGIKSTQANLYQLMASKVLFTNSNLREREEYIKNIKKSQRDLWGYGISGDLPIVLLRIRKEADAGLVRQMLNAHEYWCMKGLKVDFIIYNDQGNSYIQSLQDSVRDLIASSHARDKQNKPGGVFLYNKATMPEEDLEFLTAIARLVIDSNKGLLISQIKSASRLEANVEALPVQKMEYSIQPYKFPERELKYYNDLGGFDINTNEYVIILSDRKNTPAPWINVMANKDFGFFVSDQGSAHTWNKNSRENKITNWSNDWVSDETTEAAYIRDEDTGKIWSISAKPIRDNGEYIVEHGLGYSRFKHESQGIIGEMTMFPSMNRGLKLITVKLKNHTNVNRRLSLTYYAQLVLGVIPQQTGQYVSTYLNTDKKYIYGRNPYSQSFGNLYAFLKIVGGSEESFTGSRKEFLGRGGSLQQPEGLTKKAFSNMVGAGIDPCFAENVKVNLAPNEEKNLFVLMGQEESIEGIDTVINSYSTVDEANKEYESTKNYWSNLLQAIQVKTPDLTMDIMLNGWLMYQTVSCRLWARTAFYQSGGAYGFRDQLQDVMSLSFLRPEMTRAQILVSASRQFPEGDVQHWWHPVVDSGIRTRFSDDLLWLPYVTADYIGNTGDYSVLDETVGYLEDDPLKEGEDERYTVARKSEQVGTIYEHCIKAIERGLNFGEHNIPLMGSGDWNDGMSTVGNLGKGESVWLGWFLYSILDKFKDICKYKKDDERSQRYAEISEFIKENTDKNAWDGNWYRRAYFDDGTPLGSAENDECQIDSLAQSWGIISKAAPEERSKEAMNALEKYLIKEDKGMVLLLTPPFNNSKLEPGYIKGYVPGVRENGGQYTHAATWVILALTKMGEGNKAWKVFNMITPINHTKSYYECQTYKVEPYVMAADVYAADPHVGRGGWTWYTGTSGWMYRVGIEGILGITLKNGEGFTIKPCIPDEWPGYEVTYKHKDSVYNIKVERGNEKGIFMNGSQVENGIIPFLDTGNHEVKVVI